MENYLKSIEIADRVGDLASRLAEQAEITRKFISFCPPDHREFLSGTWMGYVAFCLMRDFGTEESGKLLALGFRSAVMSLAAKSKGEEIASNQTVMDTRAAASALLFLLLTDLQRIVKRQEPPN